MTRAKPTALDLGRDLVAPALRAAVERIPDHLMRQVAGYQLGWLQADGSPAPDGYGGKAIRPTLAVLSAAAVGSAPETGVPGAVAVELVHNFSLLHDDIMDNDVERRHRPTGWVVYGQGPAILAGNAMLASAVQEVLRADSAGRAVEHLLAAVQELIRGQSEDLALEGVDDVDVDRVLRMEAGKTASLLACSASIGAVLAGADDEAVASLYGFGHELGLAFQLVDDVLGIGGDAAVTGKSSSSDIRAGKRSAPVVAALTSGTTAGRQLADAFAGGPPTSEDDVAAAARLVADAGGLDWATREADRRLSVALGYLTGLAAVNPVAGEAIADLTQLARYAVERDL